MGDPPLIIELTIPFENDCGFLSCTDNSHWSNIHDPALHIACTCTHLGLSPCEDVHTGRWVTHHPMPSFLLSFIELNIPFENDCGFLSCTENRAYSLK